MKSALIFLSLLVVVSVNAHARRPLAPVAKTVQCTPSIGDFDGDTVTVNTVLIEGTSVKLGSEDFNLDIDGRYSREFFIETSSDSNVIVISTSVDGTKVGARGENHAIMTVQSDELNFTLICELK